MPASSTISARTNVRMWTSAKRARPPVTRTVRFVETHAAASCALMSSFRTLLATRATHRRMANVKVSSTHPVTARKRKENCLTLLVSRRSETKQRAGEWERHPPRLTHLAVWAAPPSNVWISFPRGCVTHNVSHQKCISSCTILLALVPPLTVHWGLFVLSLSGCYFLIPALDVNECLEQLDACDRERQHCLNGRGNYSCLPKAVTMCQPGFAYNVSLGVCEGLPAFFIIISLLFTCCLVLGLMLWCRRSLHRACLACFTFYLSHIRLSASIILYSDGHICSIGDGWHIM